MADNLGSAVSYVTDPTGYAYDTVVFQKEKPILDTELNTTQEMLALLSKRHNVTMPSGWLTMRPLYTDPLLTNSFYTQNPSTAIPEYALVNGNVLRITNTKTSITNANLVDVGKPPSSLSQVSAVFLESWRALLSTDNDDNRPPSEVVVDSILDISVHDSNNAWAVGENGLVISTSDGGLNWNVQKIDTKKGLNAVYFVSDMIGWVVGDSGVVARSTSGGHRWTMLHSGYSENLNGVFASSQLTAWVVGDSGVILKTNNGASWLPQTSTVTANLKCVHFFDLAVGWAVGNSGTIIKTTDGGNTWRVKSSGTTNNLNSVYFHDLNYGFAVGENGTILQSDNGGETWIDQSGNIYDENSSNYTSYSVNYSDVTMVPNLDEQVLGEDVSLQFNGVNKTCAVKNVPITIGDGKGITTSDPAYVTVRVDGEIVIVDALNGNSGQITLADAPLSGSQVTVDYWYHIDREIYNGTGEDLSDQADGVNQTFYIGYNLLPGDKHLPVTNGDGTGTLTDDPSKIIVRVNGTPVSVDSLVGSSGEIQLTVAPAAGAVVKVYHWYRPPYQSFRGMAWISGYTHASTFLNKNTATVLFSDDIGARWVEQDPGIAYDLNAVGFADQKNGWVVGAFSSIRHTSDSGLHWTGQTSDILGYRRQRTFLEGNVDVDPTSGYLPDDILHPDTLIETTKRVQIQYRIRVVPSVDPFNFPDAGLGSNLCLGFGPNDSGSFAFVNMGPLTGDYGLWRAQCSGTVDGFSYAIPMFFVARRNSSDFSATNTNGTTSATAIRPDLLTATGIVVSDILDVRRIVNIESVTGMLETGFDALMNNGMRTYMHRNTDGGDHYGIELLQMDSVGTTTPPGVTIPGITDIEGVINGDLSSGVNLVSAVGSETTLTSVPDSIVLTKASTVPVVPGDSKGYFHPNPALYRAYYKDPTDPIINGKPIPGIFSGLGTDKVTFVPSINAYTNPPYTTLASYNVEGTWIELGATALNQVPSEPKLVKSFASTNNFYYHGVFSTDLTGRTIETWDSGVSGYPSYSLVYPEVETSSLVQRRRAGTVEVHHFIRLTASEITGLHSIKISRDVIVNGDSSNPYTIYTLSKLNNITGGYPFRIVNMYRGEGTDSYYYVTVSDDFIFQEGTVFELVFYPIAVASDTNIRNAASVNFIRNRKAVNNFCRSVEYGGDGSKITSGGSVTITVDGIALGVSTADTLVGPQQYVCWVKPTGNFDYELRTAVITGLGTGILTVSFLSGNAPADGTPVKIQVAVHQTSSDFGLGVAATGILFGYNYAPYQCVPELPNTLTVEVVAKSDSVYISDLGTGGSITDPEPYEYPLINIPTNDTNIDTDDYFGNIDPMRFNSFTINSGFADLPTYIPGSMGPELTFSLPVKDSLGRYYYSLCSKQFKFSTEGLRIGMQRKIFVAAVARVKSVSDNKFLVGEYVLLIVSRHALMQTENYTGFEVGGNSVIAVYRLQNRPTIRI